jgi:hypothetical protein
MILHAQLSCLTCGYDLGEVEGPRGAAPEDLLFLPVHQGDRLVTDSHGRFRCPRCGSRVIPEGIGPARRPLDPATTLEGDLTRELGRPLSTLR